METQLQDPAESREEPFIPLEKAHPPSSSFTPEQHDYDCIQYYRRSSDGKPPRNALAVGLTGSDPAGSLETFQKRALSLLSQWGFNKEAMMFLMEKSSDPIEQLEFLETCLITLSMCGGQYMPDPKSYSANDNAIGNKDVEEECMTMRTELRTLRKLITQSFYDIPQPA